VGRSKATSHTRFTIDVHSYVIDGHRETSISIDTVPPTGLPQEAFVQMSKHIAAFVSDAYRESA